MKTYDWSSWILGECISEDVAAVLKDGLKSAIALGRHPVHIVEVGIWGAYTSFAICDCLHSLKVDYRYLGVDIDSDSLECWLELNSKFFASGNARTLHGDSKTRIQCLPDEVSYVFIDGCHCYECVLQDLGVWVPRIVPGGSLVLHDWSKKAQNVQAISDIHSDGRLYGVRRAVVDFGVENEFVLRNEFVSDDDAGAVFFSRKV